MEEDEYKATYHEIAKTRCVFEKALTNNQCKCRFAKHFWLADREGYACNSDKNSSICRYLLEKLRENSRFFLKIHSVGAQLPHNADIRIQVGGLKGLNRVFNDDDSDQFITDIKTLVEQAEARFKSLDQLPYSEIVKSIASYQGRSRSKRGCKSDRKDV
jgi:hypothetical protein